MLNKLSNSLRHLSPSPGMWLILQAEVPLAQKGERGPGQPQTKSQPPLRM